MKEKSILCKVHQWNKDHSKCLKCGLTVEEKQTDTHWSYGLSIDIGTIHPPKNDASQIVFFGHDLRSK